MFDEFGFLRTSFDEFGVRSRGMLIPRYVCRDLTPNGMRRQQHGSRARIVGVNAWGRADRDWVRRAL